MTIDEMVETLEREVRVIEPEPIGAIDPLSGWPVHKLAAWVYNDAGADWLTAVLRHADLRYEVLINNAVELERRHFPHIAAILRKVAKDALSEVDDIIELPTEPYDRGPEDTDRRRRWLLARWVQDRARITGHSRAELIAFYGIESWFTDGADTVQ
jgi:hypothetical protein